MRKGVGIIDNKERLSIFSKELNDLLNTLYEHSKTQEKVSTTLIIKNSFLYLVRRVKNILSLRWGFSALIVVLPGWILNTTTEAFEGFLTLPTSSFLVLTGVGILVSAVYLRTLVLNEMSTITSDMFHLGIYEKRKKEEFNALINLANQKDFVLTLKEDILAGFNEGVDAEAFQRLIGNIESQQEAIQKKDLALRVLIDRLEETEERALLINDKFNILMDFIYQLRAKLTLLVNDRFSLDNINFGTNYSLYKVRDEGIVLIDAFGMNKAELHVFIPMDKGTDKYILSLNHTEKDPLILDDFISWKRTLQDGSEWVLSLHLDESNRDKLNVADETGKLNLTITQELLWICCELVNKFDVKFVGLKREDKDGASHL
ncbi:hypothetical protein [Alteribacter populi]|uniref:hypothetical protein n=1 Tax=Alteribacter populi TaxID=2011011 RepID=UPI001E3500C2|nr:hypothetical protein [Alteribacter populi]